MALNAETLIGKFYTFKPRSEWPRAARETLPDDPMYYMHPVIILSATSTGMVHVVMCTSHPRFRPALDNCVPIGFESPLVKTAPLATAGGTLPKASWVQLDSKRTFTSEILVMFGGYRLGKKSKKRLVTLVEEYEGQVKKQVEKERAEEAKKQVEKERAEEAKKQAAKERAEEAKKQAAKERAVTAAAVASPAQGKGKKAKKAASAHAVQAVEAIAAATQQQATAPKPMNVLDIKTSLSGLKLAVAALEALCEKLEAANKTTPAAAPTTAFATTVMAQKPVPKVANQVGSAALCRMSGALVEDEKHGGKEPQQVPAHRTRLGNWVSRVFKRRSGGVDM